MADPEPPAPRLDDLIDAFLARFADGEEVNLDAAAATISDRALREPFRIGVLAEQYSQRLADGGAPVLDEYLAEIESDTGRAELRRIVEDGRRAGRFLPRGLVEGALLAGKYRIEREIGRGGMAIVYAAIDESLDHRCAIKVFNREAAPELAGAWEEVLRGESHLLASLESRNIVTVHAAEHDGEHGFLVMDLVAGHDLRHVLRELRRGGAGGREQTGRRGERVAALREILGEERSGDFEDLLDPRDWYRTTARILRRAARALERAHAADVLHRDLKPQNLMLVPGGEPVLLDFGLASGRRKGGATEEEGLRGTLEYLAPEQARGFRTGANPLTDLYQLGLVFYELLLLQPAIVRGDDESLDDLLERKRSGAIRMPRELDARVPPPLDAICRHLLAPDLDRRYRSARELRVDLERYDAGLPPRHAPFAAARSMWMRFAHFARRPVVRLAVLAFVTLFVVWRFAGEELPPWVPPEIRPARQEADAEWELLQRDQTIVVREPNVLGLEVTPSRRTLLYVFLVEGADAGEGSQTLRPVTPEHFGALAPPDRSEPEPLTLEPGRTHRVTCSFLIDDPQPYEGFLVYTLDATSPHRSLFDEWQAVLWAGSEKGLIPFARWEAFALFHTIVEDARRGESGAEVSAKARRLLFGALPRPEEIAVEEWRRTGFQRDEWVFPIQDER